MRALLFAMPLVVLPLAACIGPIIAGDRMPGLGELIESRPWVAQSIAGKAVIAGTNVTMMIEGGRVSGRPDATPMAVPSRFRTLALLKSGSNSAHFFPPKWHAATM
jgi:hypothetical protein